MTNVHGGGRSMLAGKQDAATDITWTEASPEGPKLARHYQGHGKLHFFLILFV